jgi:hypothetical protein
MVNMLSLFAQGTGACADKLFFGLVPWYHYLKVQSVTDPLTKRAYCDIPNFTLLGGHSDLLLVLLAVVDDLLRIAGVVAVAYVIYAGIKYIMSQGSPDETAKAQSTLVNALLGLALALVAVALVSYLGTHLAGPQGTAPANGLDVSNLPRTPATSNTIKNILTIVFSVVGALALLFITIGGFRYVLSQGDPQATGKAKNTILYALVGLIIAVTAQLIVTFVIGRVS